MTRLKKLLVAGLMAIVTCCVSFGSAIVNVTNSIFSWAKASANSNDYSFTNKHDKATYQDGDVITVQGIPSEAKKDGSSVKIPKTVVTTNIKTGEATTASETRVLIKNPYGVDLIKIEEYEEGGATKTRTVIADANQLADGSGEDANKYILTPSQVGVYTVQYAVKNTAGVWTVSDIYEIKVTADKYSMEFATNDPIIMPDKIDTNQGVDTKVNLKLPLVYDKNGEQIKAFVLGDYTSADSLSPFYYLAEYVNVAENGNVYFNGNKPELYQANAAEASNKNVYEEYYTYKITKIDGVVDTEKYPNTLFVEVKVSGIENNKATNSVDETSDNLLVLNNSAFNGDTAYYTDAAYYFNAGAGKNIVTYKLCNSKVAGSYATPDAYVSYTIDGSISYDKSNIEIGVSTSTNVKSSSTSINEKCYLPKVNAVDKNSNKNAVNAYYSYTVRFVDQSGDKDKYVYSPEYVTMGVDEQGVYFIPHKDGLYNISYNATDFYGNKDKNAEDYDYDVNVSDRTAPSLYFVNSYDFVTDPDYKYGMKEEDVDLTDISYQIPTKYIINDSANEEEWTTIAVPAIFTKDNYRSFEELKISRTLSSEKGFINTDGEVVKNYQMDIQDSNGATDFDAVDSAKKLNSTGIIYFENNETATEYVVYNNKFYKKDGFNVVGDTVTGTELTGTELKTALIKAKTSQVAYIKIDPKLFGEGEYTIEYSVQDSLWPNNSGKTFTFTLVKDTAEKVDNTAPTVKFGTSTVGNVDKNQVVTLDKPEIKDADTRLLVKYYVVANNNYLELKLDKNDKLTFNTSDVMVKGATEDQDQTIYDCAVASATKDFKVVAMAFDDFSGYPDPKSVNLDNPENNIGVDYYTVTVKYVNDTLAPVVAINGTVAGSEVTENNENKQYTEIAVHGIKFYDNTNTAQVSVKVLNSQGVEVSYEELDGSSVKKLSSTLTDSEVKVPAENIASYVYEYNFAGVKFTATDADNYTIIYNIVDGGNNVVTYSYVIRATIDAQAPHISVIGTNKTIELGETYYLKDISVSDNKTAEEDIAFSAKVVGSTVGNRSSWFNAETMEFAPKAADTYTITLTAEDAQHNASTKTIVITVKDTEKPSLTLIGSTGDNIIVDEKQNDKVGNIDWDNDIFPEITLPGFDAEDKYEGTQGFNGIIGAKGSITITTPSSKTYTVDENGKVEGDNPLKIERREVVTGTETNYFYYFTPTERGLYVASYVAEDLSGNKSEEPKIVNVYIGDTVKPDIYLTDDLKNTLTKGFTVNGNNQLVINPDARIKNATGYTSQDLYVGDNFGFKTKKVYTDDTNTEVRYEYVTVSINVTNENNNTINSTENDEGLVCYEFTKAGTYTITFTVTDSVGNIQTLTKTFKVSAEKAGSNDSTKILGTVLIIVSIVILAGVIIYFVRGTKLLPKKSKKAKKQKEDKKD